MILRPWDIQTHPDRWSTVSEGGLGRGICKWTIAWSWPQQPPTQHHHLADLCGRKCLGKRSLTKPQPASSRPATS